MSEADFPVSTTGIVPATALGRTRCHPQFSKAYWCSQQIGLSRGARSTSAIDCSFCGLTESKAKTVDDDVVDHFPVSTRSGPRVSLILMLQHVKDVCLFVAKLVLASVARKQITFGISFDKYYWGGFRSLVSVVEILVQVKALLTSLLQPPFEIRRS
ncbi:hypothetical protein H6P81_007703 [Aristolochia fimbriata]|uniref:Uncharacterized protein n=1 Tax=Aristolochia fimbriata TaxID=158543 RepID=A0AAV7F1M7_ARIFI|nr:hypothetical protein H6P81_007703 [Aristolochia fimbriata]